MLHPGAGTAPKAVPHLRLPCVQTKQQGLTVCNGDDYPDHAFPALNPKQVKVSALPACWPAAQVLRPSQQPAAVSCVERRCAAPGCPVPAAAARQDPAAVPCTPDLGQPAHHHLRPGAGPGVGCAPLVQPPSPTPAHTSLAPAHISLPCTARMLNLAASAGAGWLWRAAADGDDARAQIPGSLRKLRALAGARLGAKASGLALVGTPLHAHRCAGARPAGSQCGPATRWATGATASTT